MQEATALRHMQVSEILTNHERQLVELATHQDRSPHELVRKRIESQFSLTALVLRTSAALPGIL